MKNDNSVRSEFDRLIADLKDNPIYTMSLASKELFHSNFIAWLIEKYPDHFEKKMKRIFPEELEGESFDRQNPVDREKSFVDLTINLKDSEKKIIIENKVKSIPDKAQLERYSDAGNCRVLLSLSRPYFVRKSGNRFEVRGKKDKVEWFFMDYEYFLKNFLNFQIKKDKTRRYIEDYRAFLKTLVKIGRNIDFFSSQDIHKKLRKIKMQGIFHKIVCSKLEEKFRERIKQKKMPKLDKIKIWEFEGKSKKEVKFKDPKDKINIWTWFGTRDNIGLLAAGLTLAYTVRKKREEDLALYFGLQNRKLKLFIRQPGLIGEIRDDKRLLDDYFGILDRIKEKYRLEGGIYPKSNPKNFLQCRYVQLNEDMTINQLMEIMEETITHIINSKDLQEKMLEIYEKKISFQER